MDIELKNISVRELVEDYQDNQEAGVVGFGGKLNIRPPYQREFVYNDRQREAVIDTITRFRRQVSPKHLSEQEKQMTYNSGTLRLNTLRVGMQKTSGCGRMRSGIGGCGILIMTLTSCSSTFRNMD